MSEQQVPVPIAATLAVTQRQRNSLADENAMLWAHVEQLTAELAQLRGDGEVSGSSTSSSSSA
ncbi:hypothetical protein [Nonomuraea angiospora]|uniref:hypothetical protein n=1 Tax=Nonomuraea angiospora TaxID=46172 RepID=UPI0029A55B6F|nr:hypothetical protein [Nonomuraea angiospora]MDX3100436.1 hypothetical protein [Nonomuraea angiospora]